MKGVNMKYILKTIICVVIVVMATGCATITCTSPGKLDGIKFKGTDGTPSQLVFIDCLGYYILWVVPLVSGDIRWNNEKKTIEGGFSLFKDHVSRENIQKAITNFADSRNCDLLDITYNDSGKSYAGVSQSGIIGILFGSTDLSVSAVLVPRSSSKKEE